MAKFDVRNYGATGDGITDDTRAFHRARDAAGTGGTIMVPPGTYMVSGLTASVADQTWELTDQSIIKLMIDAEKILLIKASGVSVIGGVFDGSNGTARDGSQNGIHIIAGDVTIRNVTVQYSPYYGIAAFNQSGITISGCVIINSYYEGIFVQNSLRSPSGIQDIAVTDNLVDNSAAGIYAAGIGVRGDSPAQQVGRVKISGNTVRLPYNQVGETGALSITSGVDWAVENNFTYGGFLGITCPNPTRAQIRNNLVRGFSYVGIEIPGTVDAVTISGNIIDADGTSANAGIQASGGPVNNLEIFWNAIRNFTGSSYLISFVSKASIQVVTINANTLTSGTKTKSFRAVYFNGSIRELRMHGNIVDGSSTSDSCGVEFLQSVSSASINGNQFSNLTGAAALMAASGASYSLDFINLAGNLVVNCGGTLQDSTSGGASVGPNVFS